MVKHVQFLVATTLLASSACAGEYDRISIDSEYERLCVDYHPRKRNPDISYGGLRARHGYERDHVIPLCLGGLDVLANIQYEPIELAFPENDVERKACRDYCGRRITREEGVERVLRWKAEHQ